MRDELLAGRYRTLETIGIGGMAKVYLAEDERLGRRVAVKRLHSDSPEDAAERFEREAKLGASLNHPNLVSIFDIATDGESVLIVMEYVAGETLKDAISNGPLPVEEVLDVMGDIAAALDHAHAHGIVHRDVKPANILLRRRDGTAKLTDLGIATAAEGTRITRSGMVLGTAAYMAPEQLDGRSAGPASDIYSFATVIFEALTGKKARTGSTPVEIAHRVINDPPPDLRDSWPDAPEGAAEALRCAMSQRPADRPTSARKLVNQLEREFADELRPTPASERPPERAGAAAGAVVPVGEPSADAPPPGGGPHGDADVAAPQADAAAQEDGAADRAVDAPAEDAGGQADDAAPPAQDAPAQADGAAPRAQAVAAQADGTRGRGEGAPDTAESQGRTRGSERDRSEPPPAFATPPSRSAATGEGARGRAAPVRSSRKLPSWVPAAAVLVAFCVIGAIVLATSGGGGSGDSAERAEGGGAAAEGTKSKDEPRAKKPARGGSGGGSAAKPAAGGSGTAAGQTGGGQSQPAGGGGSQGGTGNPVALNDQGYRLMQAGSYDEAIPLLQRAVNAYPQGSKNLTYAFALYNLGRSLRLAGRPREAVPILERRLQIPNQTETVRRELEAARKAAG